MLNALKGAGREYRIEFETYSYGGMLAAVESGAVVSALPGSTIPTELKRLDELQGLPPLPSLNVSLARMERNDPMCSQLYDAVVVRLAET